MPDSPRFPSLIYGKVTSTKYPVAERLLYVRNVRLGEYLTILTDETGQFVVDAANFTSAYQVGDTVTIAFDDDFPEMDDNISVENGRIELT